MHTDESSQTRWLTPTRTLLLAVLLVLLAALVQQTPARQVVVLQISEPAGQRVACHLVVDGSPESWEDVAPTFYRFEVNELRYAIIGLEESPAANVKVTIQDRDGTGDTMTSSGVTGKYSTGRLRSSSHMEPMTSAHVASMRKAVNAERARAAAPDDQSDGNTASPGQEDDARGSEPAVP